MEHDFRNLRGFNFAGADVHLWVFKKSKSPSKYKAKYVQIDGNLKQNLISLVVNAKDRITEHTPYSHLAQNNENSCLSLNSQDTDFTFLKVEVDKPEPENRTENVSDLMNATGYVVKFVFDGATVYCVKRSTTSWKTSYPKSFINMTFSGGELSATQNTTFSIERNFDFFCLENSLFIANKSGFESAMAHKRDFIAAYDILKDNADFSSIFTDVGPISNYVGTNTTQLKRMTTIEEKGLYSQPDFLRKLKIVNDSRAWGINFDATSDRIVPCAITVKVILQVLLDHRLISEITSTIYDVPNAIEV